MSLEANKAVVRREIDFWNGHDAEKIDEVTLTITLATRPMDCTAEVETR